MGLPWVRLDSNIANHDKVLALLSDPSAKRWQAAASYMFALAWAGGQGTDGRIPSYALSSVHGDKTTSRLLEKYGLWVEATAGWYIPNWAERQETDAISASKRARRHESAMRMNCVRHHGADCHCWKAHRAP